ncbi:MAG: cell division protein FtsA [Prevotellaceae bacterium]|jgi:cell division protein FtsA|nr:cell division protein FtsA [Prevotellaceae bacterium]
MEDYIAAIDLGTTKTVALAGRRSSGGRVHVLASSEAPSQGILRGEVLNIPQAVESIQNTLNDLREKSGIGFQEVYVGISGQPVRCIENRLECVRENDREEISEDEIGRMKDQMYGTGIDPDEEILLVVPQSYSVDEHSNIDEHAVVGMFGKRLEGNYRIFIGKSKWAEYTGKCIQRAGLESVRFILKPLASAKAVLSEDEMETGVAMVDIGGGATGLTVYYDNIVRYTAIIPFGGRAITEDIRQGCGVKLAQANAMKEQYGSCFSHLAENSVLVIPGANGQEQEISFQYLAGIIEARMEEIIEAALFEIEQSGYAGCLPAGIVFTGGGALMQHLVELAQNKTGYPARVAKPLHITDDSPAEVRRCSYATAVGLLLAGMEQEEHKEKPPVPVVYPEAEWVPVLEPAIPTSPVDGGKKRKKGIKEIINITWPSLWDNTY